MVWQPKGLCYPILTKFNAKTSFIKNKQELKSPRRPISVWYKHGPTCLVLPKYLTVHIDVELNPVPLQKKPIYLPTCHLRFLAWSRIQVINYCLRIMVQATNTGMAPTCDWMIKIVKVNKLYLNSLLVSIVNRVSQSGTMKYQCEWKHRCVKQEMVTYVAKGRQPFLFSEVVQRWKSHLQTSSSDYTHLVSSGGRPETGAIPVFYRWQD